MESQRLLPGEPRSVAKARRFAEETLGDWHQDGMADVAALVVSELVTNAVLHADSSIKLRLVLAQECLRVEVHDASSVLPSDPDYGADALTGRGLHLVAMLAASWGAEPHPPDGKVVWCELELTESRDDEGAAAFTAAAMDRPVAAGPATGMAVELRALPLRLYRAVQQHNDALLREAALMAIGDPLAGQASNAALSTQAAVVSGLSAPVEDALAAGETSADVSATLVVGSAQAVADLDAALRDADLLARQGIFLTPAALPELRVCREWLLEQVAVQQDGHGPEPWSGDPVLDQVGDDLLAGVEHWAILDCLGDTVLIGNEDNRIMYANAAVEELLGWPARELVGRRITTIVPDRLREAHVAGYSRYLVTGESRIEGFPVRVPARRRDGSEVTVELTLNGLRSNGRQMFVGTLRASREHPDQERPASVRDAGAALQAAVAPFAGGAVTLDEAADAVLAGVAGALGWHFAALWRLSDDRLAASHVWQQDEFSDFSEATLRHRYPPGTGLPGRVWTSGELAWISDVVADANFPRASMALGSGLRSAFAVPLLDAGGSPLAVAEFYTVHITDPDPDFLAVLATIGLVVGALVREG